MPAAISLYNTVTIKVAIDTSLVGFFIPPTLIIISVFAGIKSKLCISTKAGLPVVYDFINEQDKFVPGTEALNQHPIGVPVTPKGIPNELSKIFISPS